MEIVPISSIYALALNLTKGNGQLWYPLWVNPYLTLTGTYVFLMFTVQKYTFFYILHISSDVPSLAVIPHFLTMSWVKIWLLKVHVDPNWVFTFQQYLKQGENDAITDVFTFLLSHKSVSPFMFYSFSPLLIFFLSTACLMITSYLPIASALYI